MEQLKLSHIAPYLPYGLKCQIDLGQNEIIVTDSWGLKTGSDYPASYYDEGKRYGLMLSQIKPLLRPLSDLYKEIDGEVGIVEIAKMLSGTVLVDKIDGCCTNLSYFKCTFEDYGFEELIINENCEGWYRSYFDKNQPSTGRNVINQFEVFTYLFQHHYDVWNLIGQNLAIDLNNISHE